MNQLKPSGYSEWRENLMGRPSVIGQGRCAVCGRLGTHKHHVIEKGAGGVTREVDRRIPLIELCSVCHDLVHKQRTLHLYWVDGLGGWVWWASPYAMDDQVAVNSHIRKFRPLPGWIEQKRWADVIGARR